MIRKSKTCNVDVIIKDRVHIIGQQDRITDKTGRRKKKHLRKKKLRLDHDGMGNQTI